MINFRRTKMFDLYMNERYDDVICFASQCLEYNPKDIYALSYIAKCYEKLKKQDEAIEVLKHILDIDNTNISAKIDLFNILYKNNRDDEAKQLVEELLDSDDEAIKNNKSYYQKAKIAIEYSIRRKLRRSTFTRRKVRHFNSIEEFEDAHVNLYIK